MAKKAAKSRSKRSASKKSVASKKIIKTEATVTKPKTFSKLPSAWQMTKIAAQMLWLHKKLFGGITLVYGFLNLILVQGLASSTDVDTLKTSLNSLFSGHIGAAGSSLGNFAELLGSSGNGSSQTAGAYQLFLAVITSLAVIWALRQVFAGSALRLRDAYYRGMYPLIPFILVFLVIGVQLIPLVVGAYIYSAVVGGGITTNVAEQLIFLVIFIALAAWSLYLLSSSVFGLYIVTLPDMTPLKSLRSAKQLVKGRRWLILRKVIWLPVVLLLGAAIIMVPIIIWLTVLAQWFFFILTMFALVAVHAYMYSLYRELLNE